MGGAYANFCDHDRGSVTPGKYADLMVPSQDLVSLPPAEILNARVELTMVGGQVQYRA